MIIRGLLLQFLVLFLPLMLLLQGASATESQEYKVKAGFVYKFLQLTFIEKPLAGPPDKFVFCIGEKIAQLESFAALEGKRVSNRFIVMKSGFSDKCHGGFLSQHASSAERKDFNHMNASEFLGVVETESDFAEAGIIRFYDKGKMIRFAVDMKRLKASNFRLSSQLLRLATLRQ